MATNQKAQGLSVELRGGESPRGPRSMYGKPLRTDNTRGRLRRAAGRTGVSELIAKHEARFVGSNSR
jgi:hypothetical protein